MDNNGIRQGSESAFPKAEYDQRIACARKLLAAAGIDVMVVTGPENIFYLTGQQTPGYYTFQALVLPVEGEPAFVVRQLEYFNFTANTFIANAEIYQDGDQPVNFLVNVIKARGWSSKRLAIDKRGWFLPIATYESLQDKLGAFHDGAGIIEQLRIVKSTAEIEKIAAAASYVEAGMRAGLAAVKAGASENDFVAAMVVRRSRRGPNMSAWSRWSPPAGARAYRTAPGAAADWG
jgi:Xaa-Pro dipeptidase